MQVVRPAASSATNGSGIELRDVRFRGKRVLKQAHVPILNVQYDGNACGPYRDWLWQESCFEALGSDVLEAQGFRSCVRPPVTMLESGQDGGNFTGVAVYESEDGALGLASQLRAGWYRYIMRWLFYPDGRIQPRFGFTGVNNSCVCEIHHHHVLWRFDFDIVRPRNVVEELNGTAWQPLLTETARRRKLDLGPRWRVRDIASGAGYELVPGAEDGIGDAFSGSDLLALRYRPKELDDARARVTFTASTDLDRLVTREGIRNQDVVVWYGAHYRHAVAEPGDDHPDSHVVGPTLQPLNWPR
jgi:hypothetical protein